MAADIPLRVLSRERGSQAIVNGGSPICYVPQPKVSILRDGTVLFNPVAVSKFMLQDGQMVAAFSSVPRNACSSSN